MEIKPSQCILTKAIISIVFLDLLLFSWGCFSPFQYAKLKPEQKKILDQMNTIAVYPLYYTDEGKKERIFGTTFFNLFLDTLQEIPTNRAVKFINPDETLSLFEKSKRNLNKQEKDDPIFKRLTPSDLQAISKEADGLIFCDLVNYREVGSVANFAHKAAYVLGLVGVSLAAASESDESIGTRYLFYGSGLVMAGGLIKLFVPEDNQVKINFTIYDTTQGISIWEMKWSDEPKRGIPHDSIAQRGISFFFEYFPFTRKNP